MLQNATVKSVVKRLPIYLDYLLDVMKNDSNVKYISSKKISDDLSLGEVQVRKDLSAICGNGKPKLGYNIEKLTNTIEQYLGCNHIKKAVLIGVGKLGSAIIAFDEFKKYGIEIIAGFDIKESGNVTDIPVHLFNKQNLKKIFDQNEVNIGIICVPKQAAQDVCNTLVELGVDIIWNFAPMILKVPKNVLVQNENLAYSLSIVSSVINNNSKN